MIAHATDKTDKNEKPLAAPIAGMLTTKHVAAGLDRDEICARRLIARGRLKSFRQGDQGAPVLVEESEFAKYIRSGSVDIEPPKIVDSWLDDMETAYRASVFVERVGKAITAAIPDKVPANTTDAQLGDRDARRAQVKPSADLIAFARRSPDTIGPRFENEPPSRFATIAELWVAHELRGYARKLALDENTGKSMSKIKSAINSLYADRATYTKIVNRATELVLGDEFASAPKYFPEVDGHVRFVLPVRSLISAATIDRAIERGF